MQSNLSEKQAEIRLKYFDRINDKLFSFNNFLMAGFIALTQLIEGVSNLIPLIPIANMLILIYIDYRMSSGIKLFLDHNENETNEDLRREFVVFRYINFLLKLSVVTTLIVTFILLMILIKGSPTVEIPI